jgi:ribonucleoside-triphosphate reductase (thioredoxin)
MTPYKQFIAKSRYARYLPMELRREHWSETSARWIEYFQGKMSRRGLSIEHPIWEDLYKSINNLEVLPSMRSIMTAGEALDRTNVAAYNCAYLPVDSQLAFDEAMYILLCGTGVGFSVENHYVEQLPTIPKEFTPLGPQIYVADSKEGWCYAFRELIDNLYRGIIPTWDVSDVRPAGAPLKTFGGRASGPGPLVDLFKYTVQKFLGARGRRLENIEAHDIMCKIGEVVVVGGVRRSAMISLGDLGDYDHANAKAGSWWEHTGERALANNSAVYHERPHIGQFMNEWVSIYESKSGERGIFNRQASKKQAAKYGRRPYDVEYGTNP